MTTTGSGSYALWRSEGCQAWEAALGSYDAVIAAQSSDKLSNLDKWYSETLPKLISERYPPRIYLDELEGVAAWKMRRGVWRERNRYLVGTNDPAKVEEASREAFAAAPDPRKPVTLLATLAGVGPATASAVLAAYKPEIYPFFDELMALQIEGLGKVAYTVKYYLAFSEAVRQKAAELSERCGKQWTAQAVSQALWAASGGKAAHHLAK